MSKKKKNKETTIENYYDLKVDKIDELVDALKNDDAGSENLSMNISDCTGEHDEAGRHKQFDPYRTDFLGKIPVWLKAIFIKFWFAGAVCYFIVWGIALENALDSLILTGVVLGLVVEILVNPLFRFMESDKKEYDAYIMFPFPFKAYWTFFANIAYYVVVLVCVNFTYLGINLLINNITGTVDNVNVGVEPLLFGLIALIIDMAFIGIKDLIVCLVRRNKNRNKENVPDV